MNTITASDSSPPAASPVALMDHNHLLSIWRSPVAYLFGGMAAVSMLISSALLLLILSYWKYKNRFNRSEGEEEHRSRDSESAGDEMMNFDRRNEGSEKAATDGEKFVVIMAGDEMPRFLASPRCYRGFDLEEDEKKVKRPSETAAFDGLSPSRRV